MGKSITTVTGSFTGIFRIPSENYNSTGYIHIKCNISRLTRFISNYTGFPESFDLAPLDNFEIIFIY